jgi:hypothetical protein
MKGEVRIYVYSNKEATLSYLNISVQQTNLKKNKNKGNHMKLTEDTCLLPKALNL